MLRKVLSFIDIRTAEKIYKAHISAVGGPAQ